MTHAIYAGSFDPFTLGHASVVERAAELFSRVTVVVAVNPNKAPMFSPDERVALAQAQLAHLENVDVAHTTGFVVEFARSVGARFMVRGVRSVSDADEELALAALNHQLAPEVETVFLPATPGLDTISSSALKERARRGALLDGLCAPEVAAALRGRLEVHAGCELP